MAKSRHRKNQKQKSKARTQRIKSEQAHFQKKMESEVAQSNLEIYMEKMIQEINLFRIY